ncbi:WRC domain-containing protein [Salix suchowensis]|nr:WRC domain-containing protein [Salix suchowensis]
MNPPPPLPPLDRLSSTAHEATTDDRLLNGIIRRASFMDSQEPHDCYRISPPFVDDHTNKLSPHSCVSHNAQLYLPTNQRPFDPAPAMRSTINASICSNQNPEILAGERTSEENSRFMDANIHQSTTADNSRDSSTTTTNSADISAATSVSSSFPSYGCWCEEEKVFPLKKRRISLERFISTQESSKVDKQKQNRKIAKMWASSGTETIYGEERDYNEVEINSDPAKEESLEMMMRCTKVNGAGWRCSKRRFEGYSLCKHHFNMQRKYNSRRLRFSVSKKRKKVMMISSILDRTMPLLDT